MTTLSHDVVLYRGDTATPDDLLFAARTGAGARQDITGWSFLCTVHTVPAPVDTSTQVYQLVGVVTSAEGGEFEFAPSLLQASAAAPGLYYYDVQVTDGVGKIRTYVVGTWTIEQDLTK